MPAHGTLLVVVAPAHAPLVVEGRAYALWQVTRREARDADCARERRERWT